MVRDAVQVSLIKDTARARNRGFTHRGMAGDITEKLLRDALRRALPGVAFDPGVITTGSRAEYDESDLSNQCDVVAHVGEPWERMYEYVVVPDKDAVCVVEVKYWIAPNNFESGGSNYATQIETLQSQTRAPVFMVGFHHSGSRERILEASNADETFLLATGSSRSRTQDMIYHGEFERLVNAIERTSLEWAD